MSSTPYRPDIDGLRAVAVLSVVAYHAWPAALPGGFVGVDVFFVISGFLITRILLAPKFSFANFYQRRVRRIFPSLLIVLAATLLLGSTFLPPDNFRNLATYAIGGGLFVSNVVAYHDAGYFSGASDLKPLVHLWSLGVEEQFYILWPLIVWFAGRHRLLRRAVPILAAISLAAFLWLGDADPRGAFFLSPPRCWELLAGALLVGVVPPARWAGVIAVAGLAAILGSAALIDSGTEFPRLLMLIPVLGACLVIFSPGRHLVSRVLSSRAAVAVGLISYPLYLWHWPLLSLLRNFERSPSSLLLSTTVAVSFALAVATRLLVERPLTRLRLRPVAAGLAAAMISATGIGIAAYAASPPETREMTNAACTRRYAFQPAGLWSCLLSRDAEPTVLVLGDSHAHHLYQGLASELPGDAVLSIGACLPMLGVTFSERAEATGACFNDNFRAQSDYLNRHVAHAPTLRWIVISAMWRPFDETGHEIDYWSGKQIASTFGPLEGTALQTYIAGLEHQIAALGDAPVTIVLDTPRRGLDVDTQRRRQGPFRDAVILLAARHPNVRVFDPMPVLCAASWCRWNELRDANHLTRQGSVDVARALLNELGGERRP